jgi:hypothetical protein
MTMGLFSIYLVIFWIPAVASAIFCFLSWEEIRKAWKAWTRIICFKQSVTVSPVFHLLVHVFRQGPGVYQTVLSKEASAAPDNLGYPSSIKLKQTMPVHAFSGLLIRHSIATPDAVALFQRADLGP